MTMVDDNRPLFIRLSLPDGLEDALEGLAREVLRHQPSNILEFAAEHFEALVQSRAKIDPSEKLSPGESEHLASLGEEDGTEIESYDGNELEDVKVEEKDHLEELNEVIRNNEAAENQEEDTEEHTEIKDDAQENADEKLEQPEEAAKVDEVAEDEGDGNKDAEEAPAQNDDEMSEDLAAMKIQAGFRGHKTRKELKKQKNEREPTVETDKQADDGIDGDTEAAESTVPEPEDAQKEELAATKIQAQYRGHVVRRELKKQDDLEVPVEEISEGQAEEKEMDEGEAAAKIQAGFRGYKTRKDLKTQNEQVEEDVPAAAEENENHEQEAYDEEAEMAATKIQAGFRGQKVRKEMKEKSQKVYGNDQDAKIEMEEEGEDKIETESEVNTEQTQVEEPDAEQPEGGEDNIENAKAEEIDDKDQEKTEAQAEDAKDDEQIEQAGEDTNAETTDAQEPEPLADKEFNGEEAEMAATKLQAGFRGYKARQEVKELKSKQDEGEKPEVNDGQESISSLQLSDDIATSKEQDQENDQGQEQEDMEVAATKLQAGYRGYKTRKDLKKVKIEDEIADEKDGEADVGEEVDIDLTDPDVENAATKIQAGFRGYKTRKEVSQKKVEHEDASPNEETNNENELTEAEKFDMEYNNPEAEMAATKIQAGFRGQKVRNEMKKQKENQVDEEGKEGEDTVVDNETDPNVEEPKVLEEAQEDIDIDLTDYDVEHAATKIQAGFRGHKARKELKLQKDNILEPPQEEQETPEGEVKEEIDIDLNDPDVEKAATKIQAGFRGHKVRNDMKKQKDDIEQPLAKSEEALAATEEPAIDIDLESAEVQEAATKIQAGYRGFKTRNEMQKAKLANEAGAEEAEIKEVEESPAVEEIDIDLEDPEVEKAATKIQAGFKGYKVRNEMKNKQNDPNLEIKEDIKKEEEVIDIDLNDPEVEQAATKIQAGFRGHKARDELKKQREGEAIDVKIEKDKNEEFDAYKDDAEAEMAAVKIQAGFRGHKVRSEMKKQNNLELEPEAQISEPTEGQVDIDFTDPECEKAATKIQAGFRGHKVRNEMKQRKEDEGQAKAQEVEPAEADQSLGEQADVEETEMAAVKEGDEKEGEEIDIDLNDPDVEKAATKIQAGFRGHKTRKELDEKKLNTGPDLDSPKQSDEQEVADGDLDKEMDLAATKLQAGYRGYKTRKELKTKIDNADGEGESTAQEPEAGGLGNDTQEANEGTATSDIDAIDMDDKEMNEAATKLQAGFRGYQTRKEMKAKLEEKEEKATDVEADQVLAAEPENEPVATDQEGNGDGGDGEDQELDVDLNDPDLEEAATKIQAGFRGLQTRKELAAKNQQLQLDEGGE